MELHKSLYFSMHLRDVLKCNAYITHTIAMLMTHISISLFARSCTDLRLISAWMKEHHLQLNLAKTELPPPLLRVFLCTGPVHPGRDRHRLPSLRRRETTDPGCSSGRRDPGPGRRLLPPRSSTSHPGTASPLSARLIVTLWSSETQSSGMSVLH